MGCNPREIMRALASVEGTAGFVFCLVVDVSCIASSESAVVASISSWKSSVKPPGSARFLIRVRIFISGLRNRTMRTVVVIGQISTLRYSRISFAISMVPQFYFNCGCMLWTTFRGEKTRNGKSFGASEAGLRGGSEEH